MQVINIENIHSMLLKKYLVYYQINYSISVEGLREEVEQMSGESWKASCKSKVITRYVEVEGSRGRYGYS